MSDIPDDIMKAAREVESDVRLYNLPGITAVPHDERPPDSRNPHGFHLIEGGFHG